MHFAALLKSLDELLFEVASWLIFWPLTLWRAVRHPLVMMRYADSELKDAPERQYEDALSPPLFLLLTLLVAHAVEVALVGDSPIVASTGGLAGFIDNDTDLLAMRMVAFAVFPLMMALRALRSAKRPVTREALKLPFYAQCYATAPVALLISVAGTLLRTQVFELHAAAGVLAVAAVVWFVSVETAWFVRVHRQGRLRALGNTLLAYGQALGVLFVAGVLLG